MDPLELKRIVAMLLLPPVSPLLLAALGLVAAIRHRRTGAAVAALGLVLAWLSASPVLVSRLHLWLEADLRALTPQRYATARQSASPPGAIVVLGGGARHDGRERPQPDRLNGWALERVVQGARIARMTGLPVLLSGGRATEVATSEAELMRRVLEGDLGVPARWLEERSRDTAGNATYSAEMLRQAGVTSVILVTHAFHVRRARAAFEAAGIEVLPAPHGFTGDAAGGRGSDWLPDAVGALEGWVAFHEIVGYWWYRLRRHA